MDALIASLSKMSVVTENEKLILKKLNTNPNALTEAELLTLRTFFLKKKNTPGIELAHALLVRLNKAAGRPTSPKYAPRGGKRSTKRRSRTPKKCNPKRKTRRS